MSRSKWKGPFIKNQNLNYNTKIFANTRLVYNPKIFSKTLVLTKFFLNKSILTYNGKQFTKLVITETMIGHKLGEFICTRKKFHYKKL